MVTTTACGYSFSAQESNPQRARINSCIAQDTGVSQAKTVPKSKIDYSNRLLLLMSLHLLRLKPVDDLKKDQPRALVRTNLCLRSERFHAYQVLLAINRELCEPKGANSVNLIQRTVCTNSSSLVSLRQFADQGEERQVHRDHDAADGDA